MVRKVLSVPPDFLLNRLLRSHRRSGLHFLCREKVTKSGRGAPRTPVRGDSLPAGGARAEGLLRKARPFGASRPSRGDQSPHVPPCPPGGISISAARRAKEIVSQRGPPRPGPPAVRGGIWADVSPLGRMTEMGPNALQNCPQLYQGESGGLEPAMKPMAGQAEAPLRFLSPLRGPGASPVNLWPLSFDQESGDPGVGRLSDKFSNRYTTHGTR